MLFKLALGNIRRSFRNYWAYFFSAMFSVFVLYLFLSVTFDRGVSGVFAAIGGQLENSVKVIFVIGAVLTALFTAFFIWYSNSFFIKSRKKEFATYMLLGMSKGQTIGLNFFENFVMLWLAFAAGLSFGVLLNKFCIMALFVTMGAKGQVPFTVNTVALIVCLAVFGAVFVLISVHSAMLLGRNSLSSLIVASKKAERGLRVTWKTYAIGALAILLLGFGYLLSVTMGGNPMLWMPIVFLVCAGTVLLFTGLLALYIHFVRRNRERLYASGGRLISFTQLSFRYRGNVGMLSTIAITTSVALCAVLTCCGMFSKTVENSRAMRPFSVEYADAGGARAALDAALKAHPEVSVQSSVSIALVKVALRELEGTHFDTVYAMGRSNYAEVIAALGRDPDKAAYPSGEGACVALTHSGAPISVGERTVEAVTVASAGGDVPLAVETSQSVVYMSLDRFERTLVVSDALFERLRGEPGAEGFTVTACRLADEMQSAAFVADLRAGLPEGSGLRSFIEHYMEGQSLMGVLMFVGVFIGLLFVIATGSILYFRMSMEAMEDRDKYRTLLRVGAGMGDVRSAVAAELAVIFGAPLLVAAANAFAALFALEKVASMAMMDTYFIVVAVYTAFYALYYRLTLGKYMRSVTRAA